MKVLRAVGLLLAVSKYRAEYHRFCRHVDSHLGLGGVPVLSLFFWANGAAFQDIVNIYQSAGFPKAINPSMSLAFVNGSAGPDNSSSNASYSACPRNLDELNDTLTRLAGAAAPVNSS